MEALLHEYRSEEALDLLEQERAVFGRGAEYHTLAALAHSQLDELDEAAEHARAGAEYEPQRAELHLLAAMAYHDAGYHTLAHRARRTWERLGGSMQEAGTDAAAELRLVDATYRSGAIAMAEAYGLKDASVAEEVGYLQDQGRWLLERGQWTDALQHCRNALTLAPGWPPPRNNASIALYYLGRVAEAAEEAETVLRASDPDNVQALSNGVRYHLVLGNVQRAHELADRLEVMDPADVLDSIVEYIKGLSLVDRDEAIDRSIKVCARRFDDVSPEMHVIAGIAAANLGRRREALRHLYEANETGPASALAEETLAALEAKRSGRGLAERFSYSHHMDWIPQEAFQIASRILKQEEKRGRRDTRRWAELNARYPQMLIGLRKMLYEGSFEAEVSGTNPAPKLLASLGSPQALEVLREFALGRQGQPEERLEAVKCLQEVGAIAPGEQVEMWFDTERRTVRVQPQTIAPDTRPNYPPTAMRFYDEGLMAFSEGRWEDAERAFQRLLELVPLAKDALNNLAAIASIRGDNDLADVYLDRALTIDPQYAFPRVNRALRAVQAGDVAAAKEWLRPLLDVIEWQANAFYSFQKAMVWVALVEKDYAHARRMVETALAMAPENEDFLELERRVYDTEMLDKLPKRLLERRFHAAERRRRVHLSSDPTLAECFTLLSKEDLKDIAEILGLEPVYRLKKEELITLLLGRFVEEVSLERNAAALKQVERAALRDVLDHGGRMEWQRFVERHGGASKDGAEAESERMSGALDLLSGLRRRGVLIEGTVENQEVVLVPRELRSWFEAWLSSQAGGEAEAG
ncbi:MAG: tetratricopeptide repeat protein [Anaerolineae bacterium]